jgi:ABC-2 type transport system ATP-binding protein
VTEAIAIDQVSKTFRIAVDPVHSVKERILRLGRSGYEEFHALQPLSLSIGQGETVGVLGHNGSGKSTLLKCIAGILTPTTGTISLRGRLASLLELGAGFHPDLSGRENVFINAAFLGISRKEIGRRFDDIVEFAELEQFIDEPVKHYSSGMYVRLGFAVAVNVEPDILLVDEVLAVGDEVFQKKCLSRVKQFQDEGRTIVVVTHAADMVREICNRAIVLDHGVLVADAEPGAAIRTFREHLYGQLTGDDDVARPSDSPISITSVDLEHPGRLTGRDHVFPGEPVTIRVGYTTSRPVDDAILGLQIRDTDGRVLFTTNTDRLETPLPTLSGSGTFEMSLGPIPLLDGSYPLDIRLASRTDGRQLDWREGQESVHVLNPTKSGGRVAFDVKFSVAPPVPSGEQLADPIR